ncbi:universal stress protein [Streptomyces sp. NPDC093105]|uniref:universal stress protein n=1 Tax=Streptomyces sp. NPDC093105 TaxID=3366029 RepID=UPI003814F524
MNEIVHGVDPRRPSIPALVWAADEAIRRGLRLRLVVAVSPVHDRLRHHVGGHLSTLRLRAESALADAEDLVREQRPGPPTQAELVDGTPAEVLVARTPHADLTVVGSRHLGRAAEVLSESSVVVPLTARAECPVVVIREPEPTAVHPPFIVVGVDGSSTCQAAVAFAVAEASLREARLRALWVWSRPLLSRDDVAQGLSERRRLLAESVAGWAERYPDVDIEQEIVRGHPVEELIRASREALALVVGRSGHGDDSGVRLGSTVHGLLHGAACPLITVPPPGSTGTVGTGHGVHRARSSTDRPAPAG